MNYKDLQKNITAAYLSLRVGIAVMAITLPFVLWIGGHILGHQALQGSMSAYYHCGGGAMRDIFVGFLFAIGAFLYLYKGYTELENYALNFAGVFVIGVALVPMEWDCGSACHRLTFHGMFAVLFFLSIAYVCIFRASDTLSLIPDEKAKTRYRRIYKIFGLAMIVLPAIAVVLSSVLEHDSKQPKGTFFVEAAGVLVFGLYWIVKSFEIARTDAEQFAIKGKLKARPYRVVDAFKEIPVERIEPQLEQQQDHGNLFGQESLGQVLRLDKKLFAKQSSGSRTNPSKPLTPM